MVRVPGYWGAGWLRRLVNWLTGGPSGGRGGPNLPARLSWYMSRGVPVSLSDFGLEHLHQGFEGFPLGLLRRLVVPGTFDWVAFVQQFVIVESGLRVVFHFRV